MFRSFNEIGVSLNDEILLRRTTVQSNPDHELHVMFPVFDFQSTWFPKIVFMDEQLPSRPYDINESNPFHECI